MILRYLLALSPHFLILRQQLPNLAFLRIISKNEVGPSLHAADLPMQLLILADELALPLEEVGAFLLEVHFFLDLLVGLRVYALLQLADLELEQLCLSLIVLDYLLSLFLEVVELKL